MQLHTPASRILDSLKRDREQINIRRLALLQRHDVETKLKVVLSLERRFGQHLILPFDLPVLKPKSIEQFVTWFEEACKPIKKVKDDVAGPKHDRYVFNSVDYLPGVKSDVWDVNHRPEVLDVFEELKHLHDIFPVKKNPHIRIWSSRQPVVLHRDQVPFFDLPVSIRVMLYDENRAETLRLVEQPSRLINGSPLIVQPPRLEETNSFGWNNFRCKHASSFQPGFKKLLLIINPMSYDFDRLEPLLTRSAEKYGHLVEKSKLSRADFADL